MNIQEFVTQYKDTHNSVDMQALEDILLQKIHDPDLITYLQTVKNSDQYDENPYKDAQSAKYIIRSKIYEANPLIIHDVLDSYYTNDRVIQTLASVEQAILGEESAISIKIEQDHDYIQTMRNLYIQDIMRALQTQHNHVSLKIYIDAAGKQLANNLLAYDSKIGQAQEGTI